MLAHLLLRGDSKQVIHSAYIMLGNDSIRHICEEHNT